MRQRPPGGALGRLSVMAAQRNAPRARARVTAGRASDTQHRSSWTLDDRDLDGDRTGDDAIGDPDGGLVILSSSSSDIPSHRSRTEWVWTCLCWTRLPVVVALLVPGLSRWARTASRATGSSADWADTRKTRRPWESGEALPEVGFRFFSVGGFVILRAYLLGADRSDVVVPSALF